MDRLNEQNATLLVRVKRLEEDLACAQEDEFALRRQCDSQDEEINILQDKASRAADQLKTALETSAAYQKDLVCF